LDKKSIALIVILVVVVIFYFQIMEMLGLYTPQAPGQKTATDTTIISPQPLDSQTFATTPQATPPISVDSVQPLAIGSLDSVATDTILIKTNKYDIILSSLGGGPVSLLLKEYNYRDGQPIQMLPSAQKVTPEFSFGGGTFSVSDINFTSNTHPGEYSVSGEPLEVIYTHRRDDGGEIIKRYTFYQDSYHFDLAFRVNEPEKLGLGWKYSLIWNTPLGITEPQAGADYEAMEAVAMMSGSRETLDDWDDGQLHQTLEGNTEWAGVRSKYFAAVMIPDNRIASRAVAAGIKADVRTPDGEVEMRAITSGLEMEFANVGTFADSFTVFVGPLDYGQMSGYEVGLEDILGIGTTPFIGWLIKPFAIGVIWLLPKMYSAIPNYGFVIILFALLVKVVTLPLSMKSFKSMQAMKDLQPKIEDLKKKHKKNPQALNKEMMQMYKTHGVSPMSGCLPMLPQMPLFFAMFSVFRQTILLRDAPFVWFIDDLSRGATSLTDPYIILVVLMIGAQFISQSLTMSSTQQNKAIMYMMPLFMGFIFYKFAAGLVLYWACFSLFSLIDYFLFKRNKAPQVQTI